MKPTLTLLTAALLATNAHAEPSEIIKGSFEYMVCLNSGTLKVRNESLEKVLFNAENYENVKLFQVDKKSKKIGGTTYDFIKVQFPNRESGHDIAWLPKNFIKPSSECKKPEKAETPADNSSSAAISGLNDKECCEFPTIKPVTEDFTTAQRRFGALRRTKKGGTRIHAACDLYRVKNEPVVAIAPGVIIRDLGYFYEGTYALEIKHSGGFIARYGEVTGKTAQGISRGQKVTAGQTVGYIGKVNSNCCEPMLHFEMYKGTAKGSLSQKKANKYQRRSDLMNPTEYLLKWYDNKFRIRK